MGKEQQPKSGGNPNTKILIIGLTVVVAVLAVGFYLVLNKEEPVEPKGSRNYIVDESNIDTIEQTLQEQVAEGMFATLMNTQWSFPDGSSASSDAYIANNDSNRYAFYFQIVLPEGEEEEVIYTSTLMPVGTKLKELKLEKNLPKGTYEAVCNYYMVDEDGEETGTVASFNVVITVLA